MTYREVLEKDFSRFEGRMDIKQEINHIVLENCPGNWMTGANEIKDFPSKYCMELDCTRCYEQKYQGERLSYGMRKVNDVF